MNLHASSLHGSQRVCTLLIGDFCYSKVGPRSCCIFKIPFPATWSTGTHTKGSVLCTLTTSDLRNLVTTFHGNHVTSSSVNHLNNISITDNKEMANAFNNFYANIGKSIDQKIPKVQKSYVNYLTEPVTSIFQHAPCTENKIKSFIDNFGSNKSSGPNSIPTNLLKEFCPLFLYPLKILINKSSVEGTCPSLQNCSNMSHL